MTASDRESAIVNFLVSLAGTLTEASRLAEAQRESTIGLLNLYQRAVGDRAPVDLAFAALRLTDNAGDLVRSLDSLADQVGALAPQWPGGAE